MSWLFLAWIVGLAILFGAWWAFLSFALRRFYYGRPPQVPSRRLWPDGKPEARIFDEPAMWVNGQLVSVKDLEWFNRALRGANAGTSSTPTTPAA